MGDVANGSICGIKPEHRGWRMRRELRTFVMIMPTAPAKYLCLLMIGANLIGDALGTGMHVHLLLTHLHEDDLAHQHFAVVHSHAGIPDSREQETQHRSAGEHRHAIAVIQIVALLAALSQHEPGACEQLDDACSPIRCCRELLTFPFEPTSQVPHHPPANCSPTISSAVLPLCCNPSNP